MDDQLLNNQKEEGVCRLGAATMPEKRAGHSPLLRTEARHQVEERPETRPKCRHELRPDTVTHLDGLLVKVLWHYRLLRGIPWRAILWLGDVALHAARDGVRVEVGGPNEMGDNISYRPQVTGTGTLPIDSRQGIEKLCETVCFCVDDWDISIESYHGYLLPVYGER
jgi:hypothetical protein